jgi:uncharacterized MAPEG superfamily protein
MTLQDLVLYAAILTFVMIMTASMLRTGGNMKLAMGNRDALPPASPVADRAGRAASNMIENMVLFVALAVAVGGRNPARATLGAQVFLAARLVYWPIYLAGIPGIRTLVWTAGMVGLVVLATAAH